VTSGTFRCCTDEEEEEEEEEEEDNGLMGGMTMMHFDLSSLMFGRTVFVNVAAISIGFMMCICRRCVSFVLDDIMFLSVIEQSDLIVFKVWTGSRL
jgi:hypothetical protein